MKKITIAFILLLSFLGNAQNEKLFSLATDAYNNGKYDAAITNYLKIVDGGAHSAELYFNLGNAYYKLNKIAPSIYYYEKALLLAPNDSEVKNNLGYAQNMTIDAIERLPETGLATIVGKVTRFFSFDQWAYLAVALMMLFVLCYIGFYYFRFSTQKRIAFISSIVALVAMLFSVTMAYINYSEFKGDEPAIVFAEEVIVNSEPNNRNQEAFRLHEGTKVLVVEKLKEWNKIQLADGKTGWVLSESIKLIK